MFRPTVIAALGVVAVTLAVAPAAQSASTPAAQESGNPINDQGSNYHYRSFITSIDPSVPGVTLQVLEFADRLSLVNRSGKTVTVYGYQGEPYARVLGNGTVEVNTHSPAYYLNQNFYGNVNVPASASPTATPDWTVVDRTGRLQWHDHRIHWMSPTIPAKVTDKAKRTKIFSWQVPIAVGADKGNVDGQLYWTPEADSKAPIGAIVGLVGFSLLAVLFVVVVRRRRAGSPPSGGASTAPAAGSDAPREVW